MTSNFSESESAMKQIALRTIFLVAILALFSIWGFGQQISGDLVGTVKDASGALVPGAIVDATNLGTGFKTTQTTNTAGEFHFVNLPGGHYSLQASTASMKGKAVASRFFCIASATPIHSFPES